MTQLKIKSLNKHYGAVSVLRNIDLEIPAGEFVVFVGPSGSGKSTLLRTICGLESLTSGTIEMDGAIINDVPASRRGIAMVFQTYALYPHMNVFDNMAYSLRLKRAPKAEIREKVMAAAEKLQLTAYLDRLPKALSGGQRQRVAIGRAIVRDPKIFLFDEPLSNLDAELRVQMRMELGQLKRSQPDTTMIYVTHDQVEAMTMADRIVVLRDGQVEQVGTPIELYERPGSLFVARFIGSPKMNLFEGPEATPFGAPTIGVRPEHFDISDQEGTWSGQVIHVENLGADSFIYADGGWAEPVILRHPGKTSFKSSDTIYFTPRPEHIHRFDQQGLAAH
ncbi:MAG: ABC transporter ATP-binding protein [Hyphomicrobiaceae bacterium]|nr:ABC transporter ATP-binding protein [Hyphomicrobiaceae bacterium]